MTEHLLSKDEIDALLHTSARDERDAASDPEEVGADPEALGQLWRLFLTATLERWSAEWACRLAVGPVRVQWGTAGQLVDGQPTGSQVDLLLSGRMDGSATGRFWAATSAADATAFTTLSGKGGPWGDVGSQEDAEGEFPTAAAEAFLKAVTSEIGSMSGQVFSEPIAFTFEGAPTLISGLDEALTSGGEDDGDDPILVELSCRLSGDGVEAPVSFLLDGESTDALLSRLAEQGADVGESSTSAGAQSEASRTGRSVDPIDAAGRGAEELGSAFRRGISGVDRPKADDAQGVAVSPAQFLPLGETRHADGEQNLDLILDVPLEVRVELGRTHMQIRDVLDLGKGSVVELDKLAGEPVDVLVNGKLLAKGEVVVIDENFGVKVTDIVSPMERIRDLQ